MKTLCFGYELDLAVYPYDYQFRDMNLKYSYNFDNGDLFYVSFYRGGDYFYMAADASLTREIIRHQVKP